MSEYKTISFSSVDDIPQIYFKQIGCYDSFYYSPPFLKSFEKTHKNIDFYYLIFLKKNEAVALAILQSLDVTIGNASDSIPFIQRILQRIQSRINLHKTPILVCGNIFLSGPYGLVVRRGEETRSVYDTLSRKLKTFKTNKTAQILVLKDYTISQNTAVRIVENSGYQSFEVAPNMKIKVVWETFEAYKASLKSKYRVKINKADSTSAQLEVHTLSAKEVEALDNELTQLYRNIIEKSPFNLANISIKTYQSLKESFPEIVHITAYRKEGTMVGFSTAFHIKDTLEAHFIGIDYTYNKTDAIYPRILNDYLRLGIHLGVSEINLGRTASEIKSSLGAAPERLFCYMKHRKTVANLFFKPLIRQIKMTDYKQHYPFKK